jgi:hypothetical protein
MYWARCAKPITWSVMFCVMGANGCDQHKGDEPKTGTVAGEVRYNGDKVPMGTVTFLADAGGKETTMRIEDGTYKIANLAPGKYHIGVSSVPPSPNGPEGFKAAARRDPLPSSVPPPAVSTTLPRIDITPVGSPLTIDVVSGTQEYSIKLPVTK